MAAEMARVLTCMSTCIRFRVILVQPNRAEVLLIGQWVWQRGNKNKYKYRYVTGETKTNTNTLNMNRKRVEDKSELHLLQFFSPEIKTYNWHKHVANVFL